MADTIEDKKNEDGGDVVSKSVGDNLLIEERPDWEEFYGGKIDETGEYKKPTQEQAEKLDKKLEKLSEIFDGADFDWSLDGALNISLYGEGYIRDHKDIDLGVFKEDLVKLEEQLQKKGLGIFLSFEEDGRRLMRHIGAKEVKNLSDEITENNLMIRQVDKEGESEKGTDEPYDSMDLHVRKRDENGDVLGYFGAKIPKEYFEPIKKELTNGKDINLSQPVLTAYYKAHENRSYDLIDLKKIKPYLKKEDVDFLRDAFTKEMEGLSKVTKDKLGVLWASLSPVIGLTKDPKVIKGIILSDKDVQAREEDSRILGYISAICNFILEHPDLSSDDFVDQSMLFLDPSKRFSDKLKVLED
ncbi:MAG: hypothetical protein NT094_03510 [Candidatus Staskawiczbacteria bacterium]|nr:hypothetical protein [Candidatus Staskawiczbacteria bacterium]